MNNLQIRQQDLNQYVCLSIIIYSTICVSSFQHMQTNSHYVVRRIEDTSSRLFGLSSSSSSSSLSFLSTKQHVLLKTSTGLQMVSIGLGPMEEKDTDKIKEQQLVPGVDYEIPNHEEYRTSRRSKLDELCDEWYSKLLYNNNVDNTNENNSNNIPTGCLSGPITSKIIQQLTQPIQLINDIEKPRTHDEWTPYNLQKLPWTPLTPSYGLEQFSLPIPRRNSEQWRHFDIPGLIVNDYSSSSTATFPKQMDTMDYTAIQSHLIKSGMWIDDDNCDSRLIYVNGEFVNTLSKCSTIGCNLNTAHLDNDIVVSYLSRLTDGFTDELVHPVNIDADDGKYATQISKLSSPNHNVGPATTQFAINTQLGTACFTALNTLKCKDIAYVHAKTPSDTTTTTTITDNSDADVKPLISIVNIITKELKLDCTNSETNVDDGETRGGSVHPRILIIAEDDTKLNIVQQVVDMVGTTSSTDTIQSHTPKLLNGYTQMFIEANANVSHTYINEFGGDYVVDGSDDVELENKNRLELKDTSFETIDVHVHGGYYDATDILLSTAGRIKVAHSITLLKEASQCILNGLSIAGTGSRSDIKTCIHHIASGCSSQQLQKNLIGGKGTSTNFRGRIRVEQSAQQTDSQQLSRTVLLGDKQVRAWTVPSLEIIADDVKCTHGATVADLSDEELFYLRSRGIDPISARNVLMYAFCNEIISRIPSQLISNDGTSSSSLQQEQLEQQQLQVNTIQQRVSNRLLQLVPKEDRAVKGEFSSI